MESARHLFDGDETVRRIARLARLELDDATLELLRRQLGDILGYVEQLDAVDTTGVEPDEEDPIPARFLTLSL